MRTEVAGGLRLKIINEQNLTTPPSVALYAKWVGTTVPFVLNSLQALN